MIQVRVENNQKIWFNDLVGFTRFQAQSVNRAPNHEMYELWTPLTKIGKANKGSQVKRHGDIQLSVCCLSEDDLKQNPELPIHTYDLLVNMWEEVFAGRKPERDSVFGFGYLQRKLNSKDAEDKLIDTSTWDILGIRVYEGKHLPKVDSRSWCDGYVQISYPGLLDSPQKTEYVEDSMNPRWNEEFRIPIPAKRSPQVDRIELTLRDYNRFQSVGVFLRTLPALPFSFPPLLSLRPFFLYAILLLSALLFSSLLLLSLFITSFIALVVYISNNPSYLSC